jgi:hypothetical protein
VTIEAKINAFLFSSAKGAIRTRINHRFPGKNALYIKRVFTPWKSVVSAELSADGHEQVVMA